MHCDPRLKWIQANRRTKDRMQRAFVPIQRLTENMLSGAGVEAARQAALVVADIVDDEFRVHCRLWSAGRGTLIVQVDNPALVCAMRLRWSGPLNEGLSTVKTGRLTGGIVFCYGEAGIRIPRGQDCERKQSRDMAHAH